ncbi:Carbohydrate family 9 binding domain-like [Paenibacillus sp. UNC496MF]|uniref:carbohydrate-binding family 9-like protein n=1 Tax=Paenibacillus sp. UNC496MF TaxID=1502753 RepID=UPI0008E8D7CC|nr:carbohydrate-binding family 9-like protein [Paenibacillus sp. UNC496MF]SFJ50326.1 Carbohydrate family 9 binding domain-like [Paenibacillus sp. UNC496MF]
MNRSDAEPGLYQCGYVEPASDGSVPWDGVAPALLTDVVTGAVPALRTTVQACWTGSDLWFRFACEDDHVVATMSKHDDPLYEEDVVELFLDEHGTGTTYYELEVSPRNVVFDARIRNDLRGAKKIEPEWHAAGMATAVREDGALRIYEIRLPLANFGRLPEAGTAWRWNAYRIDEDRSGERRYWAWRPTGAVDYHVPQRFGTLLFAGGPDKNEEA